jgi:hypothetical protein
MWILPNNLPLYSAFAQECVASKEDLIEHAQNLVGSLTEPQLTWKSKPSSIGTWLSRWNKVYWIPHLFGRTLKPSTENLFVTKYTESLEDILVNHSVLRESEKEPKTTDTCGRIYQALLNQLDLFSASLKTSQDTSQWDFQKFTEAYEIWVTGLRLKSIQRQKLARHTGGNDYSYSQYPTPTSTDFGGGTREDFSPKLSEVVNWPTPDIFMDGNTNQKSNKKNTPKNFNEGLNWQTPISTLWKDGKSSEAYGMNLAEQVNWSSPTARDYRSHFANESEALLIGQQTQDNPNMIGKNPVLNPAWVLQLMGTTLEKTFCEWRAMELSNKPPT